MPDHVVLLVVVPEDEHPVPEFGSTRFDPRDHVGGIRRVIIIGNSGLPEHGTHMVRRGNREIPFSTSNRNSKLGD